MSSQPSLNGESISQIVEGQVVKQGEPGDLHAELQRIAAAAQEHFLADICNVFAVNPITEKLIWPPVVSGKLTVGQAETLERPRADGISRRILDSFESIFVDDIAETSDYRTSFSANQGIRSFAATALRTERDKKPLAVLFLDYREARRFDDVFRNRMREYANRAARDLQNTWFVRRYREVLKISKEISLNLKTIEDLFTRLTTHVAGILDTSYFFMLAVRNPNTNTLDRYMCEMGQPKTERGVVLSGATKWVIEERKPIRIGQLREERAKLPFVPVQIDGTAQEEESLLFVPLLVQDSILGVLSAQHPRAFAYGEEDQHILELLGSHVALALSNLDLLSNLTQLNKLGQTLLQQLDSREVLHSVAEQIHRISGASLTVLYPYDRVKQEFSLPPLLCGELFTPDIPQPLVSRPDDVSSLLLKHDGPLFAHESLSLFESLGGDKKTRQGSFEVREKVESTAALPLRVGEEAVGVLFVNFRRPQLFGAPQRDLIEGLGTFAAIAIRNSRLFTKLVERRIQELELLQEIDTALSQSLDLQEILDTLIRRACQAVGANGGSVFLFNPQRATLQAMATAGNHTDHPKSAQLLAEMKGIVSATFESGQSVRVDDVRDDPKWSSRYIEVTPGTRSEMDVPLRYFGKSLGVINLESTRPAAFSNADQALIETLAGLAILAIKNAETYEREKRIADERQALVEIGQEITAQNDSKASFELILAKALKTTKATAGNLMLYDQSRDDLWMAAERGVEHDKKGSRQSVDEGVVGAVFTNRVPLRVDVCKAPWKDVYKQFIPGMCSELAVPMFDGQRVHGVINIESSARDYFDEGHERFLSALSDLAMISLRNTQSLERANTSAQRLRALHDVDREIMSLTDDPDNVISEVLRQGVLLTNAEEGDLHLYDHGRPSRVYFALRSGVGKANVVSKVEENEAATEVPRGIVAYVAEYRVSYVTRGDAQTDSNFIGDPDIHSEVAVPLSLGNDDLIGVLNLESTQPYAFEATDVEILDLLAGQAAIAIHNVRDHIRAEAAAKRFHLLNQAGMELGRISDLAQIHYAYDIVIRIAREQSNSQQTVIRRYVDSTEELVVVQSEHSGSVPPLERMKIADGLCGQVFAERRTIVVPDADSPPAGVRLKRSDANSCSLLISPVQFEEHRYGTLGLGHRIRNHFQGADVELFHGLAHQLALTIHRLEMAEARQTAEKRAKAGEVMGSIGQSAFELAHRLGNDLGAVKSYVNLVREALASPSDDSNHQIDENLDGIVRDVGNVLGLIRGLQEQLAKDEKESGSLRNAVAIRPRALLEEAANIATRISDRIKVHLEDAPEQGSVLAAYGQIADILRNLVTNAVEAMPNGGTLVLRSRDLGHNIELQVEDSGVGMSSEQQKRIFDLFYSTKGSFGFGLWSSRRNALANGGDLSVTSQPGRGAVFTLVVPKADDAIRGLR